MESKEEVMSIYVSNKPLLKEDNCPAKFTITFFIFLELVLMVVLFYFGYKIFSFEKYNIIQICIGIIFSSVLFSVISLLHLKITDLRCNRKKAIKFIEEKSKMTIREIIKEGKKKYPQFR